MYRQDSFPPEGWLSDRCISLASGESDYAKSKDYYRNLKTMVAYVRMHLTEKTGKDYSRLPFILVLLPEVINISAEKWRMR